MPVTNYIWDPETDALVMETDGDGNTTAVYTQEPKPYGGLISQRRGGVTSYYQQDAPGSTRQLTDDSEAVTDAYTYSAYGETVAASGSTVNPFRWIGDVGYYADLETADYYVRARHYSPIRGRWITVDPLLFHEGANRFSACWIRGRADPSGLACEVTYKCQVLFKEDLEDQLCIYMCTEDKDKAPQDKKGLDPTLNCARWREIAGDDQRIWHAEDMDKCNGCTPANDVIAKVFWDREGDNCSISDCHKACEDLDDGYCDLIPNKLKLVCQLTMRMSQEHCKDLCNLACKKP